jgi:hypothetical protein
MGPLSRRGGGAGFHGYLAKPVEPVEMVELVAGLLGR